MLLVAMLLSPTVFAQPYTNKLLAPPENFSANPDRTITLHGTVNLQMLALAKQLDLFSAASDDDIYIIINSTGGSVSHGATFINSMRVAKARGVRLICFVPNVAKSMAMYMFGECNKRYALPYAVLMWHPIKWHISSVSKDQAVYWSKRLHSAQELFDKRLIEQLNVDPGTYWYNHKFETDWFAEEISRLSPDFLVVIENYEGIEQLNYIDNN